MATLIPTCENAVATVPEWHKAAFKGHEDRLNSATGWSPGALNLAQGIAMKHHTPLVHAEMTRLLIDLAKHPQGDDRWSPISRSLTAEQRQKLDERQKKTFLDQIEQRAGDALARGGTVVHLSVDTQPGLGDQWLRFLYDSSRVAETDWVRKWISNLRGLFPEIRIDEQSAPTRSLSGYLRSKFGEEFLSIAVVANQSLFLEGRPVRWDVFKKKFVTSLPKD